jgi:MFS family permease
MLGCVVRPGNLGDVLGRLLSPRPPRCYGRLATRNEFLGLGRVNDALVFGKLYFPKSDPLTGTLEALAVFAVGFLARPVGAAIFGHYGDRIGRNATPASPIKLI